jgi:5'-methylthioadenosine phosphorylase
VTSPKAEKRRWRTLKKADMAIIGGSGLEKLFKDMEQIHVGTPYGIPPPISVGDVGGKSVAFLPRHNIQHSIPPHKVNYRANIYALFKMGVKRILATNAVGAINFDFKPGDLVVPHDFVDFTKLRNLSFYDEAPVTHVDMSQPFCPEVRELLVKTLEKRGEKVWNRGVIVCTEGPRLETPAEIEMFRRLGCDLVGMPVVPEAVLARELEMCYATVSFVSNMAAGIQQRLTAKEVTAAAKERMPVIQQILRETILYLPQKRKCPCANALQDARFRG